MSNRFFWDGVDLNTLIYQNGQNLISEITNKFSGIQGYVYESGQISNPNNFQSNENNGTYNTSIHKNSYYSYNSDEEDEAPPFFIDGENIFAKDWTTSTNYKKIHVASTSVSGDGESGTFNIPHWCNAVKIYFRSRTGDVGTTGGSIGAVNKGGKNNTFNTIYTDNRYRDDTNGGRNENKDQGNSHDRTGNSNDWDRHYHHNIENWHHNTDVTGASGAAGGAGGACVLGFFTKYAKFTAGTNNTMDYSFSSSNGGTSTVTLKQDGTTKVQYKFKNGTKGETGNNAYWRTNNSNNDDNNTRNHRGNDDDRNWTHTTAHNHRWPNNTAAPGSGYAGNPPTAGSVDVGNTTTGDTKYLAYNDGQTTSSSALYIYYFKYRTTLRNSNPFTWTSYSNYGGSGYTKNNLSTRTVTTNTGYAPQDLYWARSGTLGNLEYNTNVSPATSTVQQLPSGFPSGHAFYLTYSVNVTLKKFDIYVSNHELNEPFFPEKLRIYGASLSSGSDGVEIYSGKPVVISDIPDNKSVDYGGSNECNNTTAYKYYFFVIEEIVGPIAASNIYYGLKINYIHPFIQENI